MNDEVCVFCRIARKQAAASLVYEDESVLAFLDINPLSEGHTLVVPREHYANVFDMHPNMRLEMITAEDVALFCAVLIGAPSLTP